jgi:preprotein translocase subunit SecG
MPAFLMNLVLFVQLASALVMIVLVLLQHGKGADMGASFGSGASGTLFGATGSANVLSRATAFCAAVFFICTLGMAYISSNRVTPRGADATLLDAPSAASAAASTPTTGAAAVPGAAVAPKAAASAASAP